MIGDKPYLRSEKFLTPNKPIGEALENIRTNVDLDKDFSLSVEDMLMVAVVKKKRIMLPDLCLFLTYQGEIGC